MKTVVVGLDPSSKKIAMSISVNGKKPIIRTTHLGSELTIACIESYRYVRKTLRPYVQQGYRVVLFVEDPVVGRGGIYSTLRQSKTNGAMLAGGMSAGAEVRTVNNKTWKKQVCGNGNASKDIVKAWVRDNWQVMYLEAGGDQDVLDSLCILRYGEKIVDKMDRIEELTDSANMELAGRRTSRRR